MSDQMIAALVFGVLCLGALVMFALERRAVARRKADGTYVDPSDILFFGSAAATGERPGDKD
jgi:nitrate reductase gamma subunit